ncbi:MAG: DoxX family protein [Bacteroidales bacterium]
MKTYKPLIGISFRIVIGLVFILSAVLKYLSIEVVDLFFFEHKLLPWVLTTFASRLLIAFEAIVGLMLVVGIYPKITKIFTFLTLIGFTVYVILKPFLFDVSQENCFCFGDKIQLSDTETIVKNIILILMALTLNWAKAWKPKYKKYILTGIIVLTLGVTFIVKPPDFIQAKIYKHSVEINPEVFEYVKSLDNVKALNIDKGRKVLCWYGTGCKYCKRAAKKIDIIIDRNSLNKEDFVEIFGGKEKPLTEFYKESGTDPLNTTFISVIPFINTTNGIMPVIFLLENGNIIQLYKLTTIDEDYIVDFLTNKN